MSYTATPVLCGENPQTSEMQTRIPAENGGPTKGRKQRSELREAKMLVIFGIGSWRGESVEEAQKAHLSV